MWVLHLQYGLILKKYSQAEEENIIVSCNITVPDFEVSIKRFRALSFGATTQIHDIKTSNYHFILSLLAFLSSSDMKWKITHPPSNIITHVIFTMKGFQTSQTHETISILESLEIQNCPVELIKKEPPPCLS